MSLRFRVLASGSAGNCAVLAAGTGRLLIDCGIAPRTAARRLGEKGPAPAALAGICLTHLDADHFHPAWIPQALQQQLRIFCSDACRDRLLDLDSTLAELIAPFHPRGEPFEPLPGVAARAVSVPHDQQGAHAFYFAAPGARLGYATDLGHVPSQLLDCFADASLLAVESNYDPHLQRSSGRPIFLQHRITSGRGHLSNEQALAAVKTLFDRSRRTGRPLPRHVVLLHRSRQCNCPQLLRNLFAADAHIAPRLVLAEQHHPTPWLNVGTGEPYPPPLTGQQLSWGWG